MITQESRVLYPVSRLRSNTRMIYYMFTRCVRFGPQGVLLALKLDKLYGTVLSKFDISALTTYT